MRLLKKYKNMSAVMKAGIWFTICNFLQKGISFITVPIFTRLMETEEYGVYSVYTSWYSILTIFCTLHLSYYVFDKGLVKYEDDRNTFVVSIQSLSATITACFIIIYLLFKVPINMKIGMTTSMMLCMLIQILFEPPISYYTARNRFDYKYKAVIAVTVAISILNPVIGISLIKLHVFNSDALSRVFSISLVATIFGTSLSIINISRAKVHFSTKYWKYALNFNLPLIPHYLSATILSSSDRIMIGDMVGKSSAAIYSVAYAIGIACTLFSQAIHHAYLPWLYKRMKKEYYDGIPKISTLLLFGMLGIISLLICFAPEVVWVVGSEKYKDAIWVIPPVCGSVFFIFLKDLFANVEYYYEKTKIIAFTSIGVALLNLLLNYIFIQIYGFVAAGYTTLFCYLLYAGVHYIVLRHICKENSLDLKKIFNQKSIITLSATTLVITSAMLIVYRHTMLRYLIVLLIVLFTCIKRKDLIKLFYTVKETNSED